MKRLIEVWMEGYWCTGMELGPEKASLIGKTKAESFKNACDKLCKDKEDYDSERLMIWGCQLYDNETDARKEFG